MYYVCFYNVFKFCGLDTNSCVKLDENQVNSTEVMSTRGLFNARHVAHAFQCLRFSSWVHPIFNYQGGCWNWGFLCYQIIVLVSNFSCPVFNVF